MKAVPALKAASAVPTGTGMLDLLRLGWARGKEPREALFQRLLAGMHRDLADGFPTDRQGARIWTAFAEPHDRRLANDKRATAERLEALGLPVPRSLAEIAAGAEPDVSGTPWTAGEPLFVKPRHGMAGWGTMAVVPVSGGFRVNDGPPIPAAMLAARLALAAKTDSLLVQPFMRPAAALADLSPHAPPGLRVTIARPADGEPFVLDCFLRLQPPGAYAANAGSGALMVPASAAGDRLLDGVLFARPGQRHASVPWSGTPIRGRHVPELEAARCMALRGSVLFPGLPVVGWDLLLTEDGPVMLEANWCPSWMGMHLGHLQTGTPSPLPDVLLGWVDRAGSAPLTPPAGPAG